jgi:hypothetical protein
VPEDEKSDPESLRSTKGARFISGKEWIVLSILAMITGVSSLRYGIAPFLESSIGRLVVITVVWVLIREVYRSISKK